MPKLLAHLEVRSRHLRAGFTESCEMLWDITVELLKQPELLAGLFQSRYRRDAASIVREAENQLRARNLPTEFAEDIAQTAVASLTTPLLISSHPSGASFCQWPRRHSSLGYAKP